MSPSTKMDFTDGVSIDAHHDNNDNFFYKTTHTKLDRETT